MTSPLDGLHDFYQPPQISWRPQTIGWYIVFSLFAIFILWFAVHLYRRWLANRYRREALIELDHVAISQLSALLKRTALSTWPREEVASLSGESWLKFLNGSIPNPVFENEPANRIEELAFSSLNLSSDDEAVLRSASANWIKLHKPPPQTRRPHVSS